MEPDMVKLSAGRGSSWEAQVECKEDAKIPNIHDKDTKKEDADEEEKKPQSRSGGSRLAARTLKRRKKDYRKKYREQVARGRPDRFWKLCSDPACFRRRCRYVDLRCIPVVKADSDRIELFCRRRDLFLDAMVVHLFGENLDCKTRDRKEEAVESFILSPPVEGAMGQFDIIREGYDLNPGSEKLAKALTEVRFAIICLVSKTRLKEPVPDVHVVFGGEERSYPKDWTLRHLVMQFCAVAEAWRRYVLERGGKEWDFGSDEAVADFLSAILLNFHTGIRRYFLEIRRYSVQKLNDEWDDWLDYYGVMRDESEDESEDESNGKDEAVDEEDCIQGFGTGNVPWMSERMKEACGWYGE